jgi:restriction system protein
MEVTMIVLKLQSALKAALEACRHLGSDAFGRGDYELVDRVKGWAQRLTELYAEVERLHPEVTGRPGGDERTPPLRRRVHGGLDARRDFRRPILEALVELGGRAPASEVLARVYQKIKDRLPEVDRRLTDSGAPRWHKKANWCRYHLVRQGLLKADSPRGIWEISDLGRAWLREHPHDEPARPDESSGTEGKDKGVRRAAVEILKAMEETAARPEVLQALLERLREGDECSVENPLE